MRKLRIYRLGLVAILTSGIGFMTVTVDHKNDSAAPLDLEGLKGPVHALDEINNPRDHPPSNWI